MARSLTELQKQYNSSASAEKRGMPMMRGPGGPRGMGKGKPKNTKNTKNKSLETLINKDFSLFLLVFFVVLAHPSTTAVCCSWWCQISKHQEQPRTVYSINSFM